MTTDSDSPICIDLFAGAGGLSEGLRMAGFRAIAGVDFDKHAMATYARNHPGARTFTTDITKLDPEELRILAAGKEIDLLAGGPSCQGYSTHGKRDAEDPRNFLFEHYLRLAAALRPKWILIENVQGLLTYNKGFFKDQILERLRTLGYAAEARVLCSADYGVPQRRYRIFFLANRIGAPINFPAPTFGDTHGLKPFVTVGEAIGDLPLLISRTKKGWPITAAAQTQFQKYARDASNPLDLHQGRPLSDQALSIARHVREGYGLRSVPVEKLPERFTRMRKIGNGALRSDCTTLYHRLDRDKPSYTITTNFRNVASGPFLHPVDNRSISFREAARLMSFRDSYEFMGTSLPRQIGNAVPPLLARAVGREIIKSLKKQPRVDKKAKALSPA